MAIHFSTDLRFFSASRTEALAGDSDGWTMVFSRVSSRCSLKDLREQLVSKGNLSSRLQIHRPGLKVA